MAEEKTKMSVDTLKQLFKEKSEEHIFEYMAQEYVRLAKVRFQEYLSDNPAIASIATKASVGIHKLDFKEKELVLEIVPTIIYDEHDEEDLNKMNLCQTIANSTLVLESTVPVRQIIPFCEALTNLGFEVLISDDNNKYIYPIITLK